MRAAERNLLEYEYAAEQSELISKTLEKLHQKNQRLFVVIDDDPTGGQTVHDIRVYTQWTEDVILRAFQEEPSMFYIMTNSRSMTLKETIETHKEILNNINNAAKVTGRKYEIISRGDSTLRGHYPAEPDVICQYADIEVQKELLIPFFLEGNRFTINDIHYLREGDQLIPAGESEFSKDKTFGFDNSDLKLWIEEKTNGAYKAKDVASVSLEMLRNFRYDEIEELILSKNYKKVIVNATCYMDLKVFAIAYFHAIEKGAAFVARTASSWPKTVGCVSDIFCLKKEEIVEKDNQYGGLIIIGSHVHKTTKQLETLKQKCTELEYVEFNQHLALEPEKFAEEIKRVCDYANTAIESGKTVVVYRRKERLDVNTGNKEDELRITNQIAKAITTIAENINNKPKFVIAKGGITSSEIAVKAFQTKEAVILGQVEPGIPVWKLGKDSKYPNMPYVVFPGNVGNEETLYKIVTALK